MFNALTRVIVNQVYTQYCEMMKMKGCSQNCDDCPYGKTHDYVLSLIRGATQAEVIKRDDTYYCPACGKVIYDPNYDWCVECGQRLVYADEEE